MASGRVPKTSNTLILCLLSNITFRRLFPVSNDTRVSDHDGMRGNVTIYKGIRSDHDIITNGNLTDNRSIDSDPNPIPDGGCPHSASSCFETYRHPLVNIALLAKDSSSIDGNVVYMSQIEAFSDTAACRDLDSMLSGMETKETFIKKTRDWVLSGLRLSIQEMEHPDINGNLPSGISGKIPSV